MRISLLPALLTALGLAALASAPVPAAGKPGASEIHRLIDQLGSPSFTEREEATAALDATGEPALPGLRRAAESDDAEVRRRAGELVQRIEHRLETDHLLASTKVNLSFKDTPVPEAVAELCKQSGCKVVLQNPSGALRDRKVTLNTGDTTFWEALDRICSEARVTEDGTWPTATNNPATVITPIGPPGAFPAARRIRVMALQPLPVVSQITLAEKEPKAAPTAFAGAVRVRALRNPANKADASHIPLELLVTAEPRIRCQDGFTLRINKVVDNHGQELAPTDESGPALGGFGRHTQTLFSGGFPVQYLQARLNAGEKASGSLREVHGTLTGKLFTEPRPLIAADNVLKSAGKSFSGKEGGAIRVLEANASNGRVSLRIELDVPPDITLSNMLGGIPFRVRGPVRGAAVFPAGGGAVPVVAPAVGVASGTSATSPHREGLSLLDEKGTPLEPIGIQMSYRQDVRGLITEYALTFNLATGREASKLVFAAGKSVNVEIPFTIRDIPLP